MLTKVNFTNFKDVAIFIYCTNFKNFWQLFHFAAQQFTRSTVQNYWQDWNDVLMEGSIMLITLSDTNTVKTTFTIPSLKKERRGGGC